MHPRHAHLTDMTLRRNMITHFKQRGCFLCGVRNIALIDAHHLNKRAKSFNIATTLSTSASFRFTDHDVVHELRKCIPLCKNCHARTHRTHALDPLNKRA